MLERGDVLLTWQLLRDPTDPANYPIPARRIGDHRKAYLTYEGPLSGNRGTVRRVDEGSFRFIRQGAAGYSLDVNGRCLSGRFDLIVAGGEAWFLATATRVGGSAASP